MKDWKTWVLLIGIYLLVRMCGGCNGCNSDVMHTRLIVMSNQRVVLILKDIDMCRLIMNKMLEHIYVHIDSLRAMAIQSRSVTTLMSYH